MDNKILERLSEIISSFAEARDIVENASDEIGEILKELDRDGSIYDVIESYSRVYSLPDMWSEDADALDANRKCNLRVGGYKGIRAEMH